jgi:hypothetical protein
MGIGPQNLGAAGMNPKSTPCGHSVAGSPMNYIDPMQQAAMQPQQVGMEQPGQVGIVQPQGALQQPQGALQQPMVTPFNKLTDLSGDGKITQKDVLIGRGVIKK